MLVYTVPCEATVASDPDCCRAEPPKPSLRVDSAVESIFSRAWPVNVAVNVATSDGSITILSPPVLFVPPRGIPQRLLCDKRW